MKSRNIILSMFLVWLSASLGWAQSTTGTITGTVTDPTGAVIPGAGVTITNTLNNVSVTVTTNAEGVYVAQALLPSNYTVSATATGFVKLTKSGIKLEINQTAEVNLQLAIGGTEQVVEVSAAALLLQTEQSSVDQTVEQKLIEDLPLVDQNVMQLVQITPGVVSGNPANPSAIGLIGNRSFFDSNFSVNGGRASTNDVLVDGVANTIGDFNGVGATPPARSVQEFKIMSGTVSAEYGRAGGGVVSYATRPGGNIFHGSVFNFHQNSALNANTWSNNRNKVTRVTNRRNHFGTDFSGPVWIPKVYDGRQKTFFFFNYEGRRNRDPFEGLFTVPTEKLTSAAYAKSLAAKFSDKGVLKLADFFLDSLTVDASIDDEWRTFVEAKRAEELDQIIVEEGLDADQTRQFVDNAFRDGGVPTAGTAVTRILPPVTRFSSSDDHGAKKQTVLNKLGAFFERYFALS